MKKFFSFLNIFIFSILAATTSVAADWQWKKNRGVHPTPIGFDKYLTYVADGFYNPNEPHPNPQITGCDISTFCDADYFQEVLMGRTPAEVAELEQQAKDFFNDRFGIDVDDPANIGRIFFRPYMIDPRINYHVVSASGERVPSEGWTVTWGGWIVLVIDPAGIELGGDFAGTTTPFNGQFIIGENYIEATRKVRRKPFQFGYKKRKKVDPIIINFRSQRPPVVPVSGAPLGVQDNTVIFQLETMNEDFGEGLSRGRGEIVITEEGFYKLNIVNVITFPGLSDIPFAD